MGLIFLYCCCILQHLHPLRIRMHSPLTWDEQYEPFIHRAGFLPLARLINHGLPMMDGPALMSLVDRWRPEIHTFHLPSSETMVTLQDVAMILGLPIDGTPVCGLVSPTWWRDSIGEAIGLRPPMSLCIRRTGRRWTCTPGGSQLTSTLVQRVLRMLLFRGMFGLMFGICMMSDNLLT
jgi:hypothetical protein